MSSEVWESVIASIAANGSLLFLTKSWISERLKNAIKHEYDAKLETHKAELGAKNDIEREILKAHFHEKLETHKIYLKAESDVEAEKLRASLTIVASEQQIKFATLHEDRANVISETYALLKEVYYTLGDYIKIFEPAGDKPREERQQIARDAHKAFREFYPKKLIYLPKTTADNIENINTELVKIFNIFTSNVHNASGTGDTETWVELSDKMRGKMKVVLGELEDEFRKLLGDEN